MDTRRVLLIVEYDGTSFHGWQRQSGLRTVQGELESAVRARLGEPSTVEGASRTDTGVHAVGQAAIVDTTSPIPDARLAEVLDGALPGDVHVRRSTAVDPGFHPRFAAVGKVYRYSLRVSRRRGTLLDRYAWRLPTCPDLDSMRRAAAALEGEHDFRSLQNASSDPPVTTVRRIHRVAIHDEAPFIHIEVAGSGFLYRMVRNIAGLLVDVGVGRRGADRIPAVIAARDRRAAGPTAPPQGLCLVRVAYSDAELGIAAPGLLGPWVAESAPGFSDLPM